MKHYIVEKLISALKTVLGLSADKGIFCNNLNPLRAGLMFYKLIEDLHNEFGFSDHVK